MQYFNKPFTGFVGFNPKTGIFLILIFGAIRFLLVLGAAKTGNFSLVSMVFLMMWITPFLLLNKAGRRLTGIRSSRSGGWLLLSFLFGIAACGVVFCIGWWLFGHQPENWFVYIAGTYNLPEEALTGQNKIGLFPDFCRNRDDLQPYWRGTDVPRIDPSGICTTVRRKRSLRDRQLCLCPHPPGAFRRRFHRRNMAIFVNPRIILDDPDVPEQPAILRVQGKIGFHSRGHHQPCKV